MAKTMKMVQIENKRISNNFARAPYTSAITTQKYIQCFEMKGGEESWKEDEKASWTSVFSLMLIIYVVCAFYYYYLFIYYFLFSSLPVFQRHHGQGSHIKLLSLVSKGFLPIYLYISSSLHLSCCYLVRQTHKALMRSKPDMYSSLLTPRKSK